MGLTIHYQLSLSPAAAGMEDARAQHAVAAARKLALTFKRQGRVVTVSDINFDPPARRIATDWRFIPVPGTSHSFTDQEIRPQAGWLFCVEVGRDCEPLWLGLCRYDRPGWRLKSFAKTQFASLHGWEHFQRCHCAIVDLLAELRTLGFTVRIRDEGDFWPRRSLNSLRQNIEEMNGLIAAAAGVAKDCSESYGGPPVQSPIFKHPQFEHLEAAGAQNRKVKTLRRILAQTGGTKEKVSE